MKELLLLFLFIIISAIIDAHHVKRQQYIESHLTRFLLRLIFVLALSTDLVNFAAYSLLFGATFDQAYNIAKGNDLMYLGTVAPWDRFFNEKKRLYIVVKILMLTFGVILLNYGVICT